MSDDISEKIKQFAALLGGKDNLQDNLQEIIAALGKSNKGDSVDAESGGQKEEEEIPSADSAEPQEEDVRGPAVQNSGSASGDLAENLEMMRKLSTVMDKFRDSNDSRVSLLRSVKPFLGNRRQKKIQNCITLLQLGSVSKLLE
ncbi:MAG: hypothetical protein PHV32_05450 [Eubacteriales bacterium]|nr:hypothetical protein [Eubacteriales bacterium]